MENTEKLIANKKRSLNNTLLRKKNLDLRSQLLDFKKSNPDLPETTTEHLDRLTKNLWFSCSAGNTVYRRTFDNEFAFMGSMDSGNKLDFATNSRRSKALRRKYSNYLQKNEETGYTGKRNKDKSPVTLKFSEEFDFFHMVLTVPHSLTGYKGKAFYAKEIMERFNVLRKDKTFTENVYGGEYSCEIVKTGENGLHIHLHVLVLLRKFEQNRNYFGRWLFKKWNSVTEDKYNNKTELSQEEKKAIQDTWKLTNGEIEKLKPNGALRMWFESLYITSEVKKGRGWRWDEGLGKYKKYCNSKEMDQMIYGIMECLKYHFEPFVLEDATGNFDIELILEILPNIYKQPLYRKFGKFHGVKELNVNSQFDFESIKEELEEVGGDAVHPITGEELGRDEYQYIMADPQYVFHDKANNNRLAISKKRILEFEDEPFNLQSAFEVMINKLIFGHERKKIRELSHQYENN